MEPLTQALLQRHLAQSGVQTPQAQPAPLPATPPNAPERVPQQAKRWSNAQQIQDAYRSGWTPNPVLLQAMLGHT